MSSELLKIIKIMKSLYSYLPAFAVRLQHSCCLTATREREKMEMQNSAKLNIQNWGGYEVLVQ
jgi:hypothetical protein